MESGPLSLNARQVVLQEVHPGVVDRCQNCGLVRYDVAKQVSKPTMNTAPTTVELQYINVHSSSGKIDTNDLPKVRTHVMLNHQKRRHLRTQASGNRTIRPKNCCTCRPWSTSRNSTTHQIQSMLGAGRCDPLLRLPKGKRAKAI